MKPSAPQRDLQIAGQPRAYISDDVHVLKIQNRYSIDGYPLLVASNDGQVSQDDCYTNWMNHEDGRSGSRTGRKAVGDRGPKDSSTGMIAERT